MPGYRGASQIGDGATATATTYLVPMSSFVAGDAVAVYAEGNFNGVTASISGTGWTTTGPTDSGTGNRSYLFTKDAITSTDVSSGVTVTWSGANRGVCVAQAVYVGNQLTPFGTPASVTAANTSAAVTTTQAKSVVLLFGSNAGTVNGAQAPVLTFTDSGAVTDITARSFTTGANRGAAAGHIVTTAAGSYGGATVTNAASPFQSTSVEVKLARQSRPFVRSVAVNRAANF